MSYSELITTIFDQFIQYVIQYVPDDRCNVTKCDFNYKINTIDEKVHMKVINVSKDKCNKSSSTSTIIDISGVCFKELDDEQWKKYLKRTAILFVQNICPKTHVIETHYDYRYSIPLWIPKECKTVTTITKELPQETQKPEVEYIYKSRCDDCGICCNKKMKPPKHECVVEYIEPKSKCGPCQSVPVTEKYETNKKIIDYNDHKFKTK